MNSFEPGEYVRLRSGGRKMQVIKESATETRVPTSLIACEYLAKHRRVLGFYAAHSLISIQRPDDQTPLEQ